MMKGNGYTFKVKITKENIEKKDDVYEAKDLFLGFDYEECVIQDHGNSQSTTQQTDSYTAQVKVQSRLSSKITLS